MELSEPPTDSYVLDDKLFVTYPSSGVQIFSKDLSIVRFWCVKLDQKLNAGATFKDKLLYGVDNTHTLVKWKTQSSLPVSLLNNLSSVPVLCLIEADDFFYTLLENSSILQISIDGKLNDNFYQNQAKLLCWNKGQKHLITCWKKDEKIICSLFQFPLHHDFIIDFEPEQIWCSLTQQCVVMQHSKKLYFFKLQNGELNLAATQNILKTNLVGNLTDNDSVLVTAQKNMKKNKLSLVNWNLTFYQNHSESEIELLDQPLDSIHCIDNTIILQTETFLKTVPRPTGQVSLLDKVLYSLQEKSKKISIETYLEKEDWTGLQKLLNTCATPGALNLTNLAENLIKKKQDQILLQFLKTCITLQEDDVVDLLNFSLEHKHSIIYTALLQRTWTLHFLKSALTALKKENFFTLIEVLLESEHMLHSSKVIFWITALCDVLGFHLSRELLIRIQRFTTELSSTMGTIGKIRAKLDTMAHPRKRRRINKGRVSNYVVEYIDV